MGLGITLTFIRLMTTTIIIIAAIILVIIDAISKSNEKLKKELQQKKIQEQKKLQEEEQQREIQKQKRLKEKEQQKLAEELLETLRLQKIEDEKYETFKIVLAGQRDDEFTCVLERENKTYAYVARKNIAFQLGDDLKLQKEISNEFEWITQADHNKIQEQNKLELKRLEEVQRQAEIEVVQNAQRNFCETNTVFSSDIEQIQNNISFNSIRRLSVNFVKKLPQEVSSQLHFELNRGGEILQTEAHLHQYIHSYGNMHQAKLNHCFEAIKHLLTELNARNIQIIDYGCGQGIGSIVFIDFIKANHIKNFTISKIRLIEPSEKALKRASLNVKHCLKSINQNKNVLAINKSIDEIDLQDLSTDSSSIKFHIFSNILDVENFNINLLAQKIDNSQKGTNYFICVSPKIWEEEKHPRNLRLDIFMDYFQQKRNIHILSTRETNIGNWKRYERVFKVIY